jgi:hypothetical protein
VDENRLKGQQGRESGALRMFLSLSGTV